MSPEIKAAIDKLQAEHDEEEQMFREMERTVYGKKIAINTLLALAGEPPRFPESGGNGGRGAPQDRRPKSTGDGAAAGGATMKIRSDTFYGKRQQTAVREYLEMRKAAGQGAATPREIFDALKTGGFQYEAKEDTTALVGLRALLRKRTAFFHKLPNGTYGLTSWYPDAKKPKGGTLAGKGGDDDGDTSHADHDDDERDEDAA